MSNVIQVLEAMGRNPTVQGLSSTDYAASVAVLEADDAQRQALLACDAKVLNRLLEGQANVFRIIATPDVEVPDEAPERVPGADEPVDPGRVD